MNQSSATTIRGNSRDDNTYVMNNVVTSSIRLATGESARLEGVGATVQIKSDSLDLLDVESATIGALTWIPTPYTASMNDAYIKHAKQAPFPPNFWSSLRQFIIGSGNNSVRMLDNGDKLLVAPPETINLTQPIYSNQRCLLRTIGSSPSSSTGPLTIIGRRRDLELELDVGGEVDVVVDSAKFKQLTIYSAGIVQLTGNGRINHVVRVGPGSMPTVVDGFQVKHTYRYHPQTMAFTEVN